MILTILSGEFTDGFGDLIDNVVRVDEPFCTNIYVAKFLRAVLNAKDAVFEGLEAGHPENFSGMVLDSFGIVRRDLNAKTRTGVLGEVSQHLECSFLATWIYQCHGG